MKTLALTAGLSLLAAPGDKPRRFAIAAYSGGTLSVEGFPLPVIVDLAGLEAPDSIPILVDHQNSIQTTIGQTDRITNTGREILLVGPVTVDPPREGVPLTPAQQVIARSNHKWRASIGVLVQSQQEIPAGQQVNVNGQTFTGPVIVARRSQFGETSVLAMGADSTTQVNLAAAAAGMQQGNTMQTFETWLTDKGFDPATLTPEATAFLTSLFDAETNSTDPAATANATAAALVNFRAAANHQRIAKIESLTIGHPAIAATVIQAGWTQEQTEIAVLKAKQRQIPPSNHRTFSGNGGTTSQHLSAALMVKAGYSTAAEKSFGANVMEQSRHLHGQSLPDLCKAALVIDGRDIPH